MLQHDDTLLMNSRRDREKARKVARDPRVSLTRTATVTSRWNYRHLTLEGVVARRDDPDLTDINLIRDAYRDDYDSGDEQLLLSQPRRGGLRLSSSLVSPRYALLSSANWVGLGGGGTSQILDVRPARSSSDRWRIRHRLADSNLSSGARLLPESPELRPAPARRY